MGIMFTNTNLFLMMKEVGGGWWRLVEEVGGGSWWMRLVEGR